MKNYEVTVNGKVYQVAVKEIEGEVSQQVPLHNTNKNQESTSNNQSTTTSQVGVTITAPMPGRILSVKVQENQTVQAGDTVCLLEAMKMENEIVAPVSGVIAAINVQSSQTVEVSESLMVITPR